MSGDKINEYNELILSDDDDQLIPNIKAEIDKEMASNTIFRDFFNNIYMERDLTLLERKLKKKNFFGKKGRYGRQASWNRGVSRILQKYGRLRFYSMHFGLLRVVPNDLTQWNKWGKKIE